MRFDSVPILVDSCRFESTPLHFSCSRLVSRPLLSISAIVGSSRFSPVLSFSQQFNSVLFLVDSARFGSSPSQIFASLLFSCPYPICSNVYRPLPEFLHCPKPLKAPYSSHSSIASPRSFAPSAFSGNHETSNSNVVPAGTVSECASATTSPCAIAPGRAGRAGP